MPKLDDAQILFGIPTDVLDFLVPGFKEQVDPQTTLKHTPGGVHHVQSRHGWRYGRGSSGMGDYANASLSGLIKYRKIYTADANNRKASESERQRAKTEVGLIEQEIAGRLNAQRNSMKRPMQRMSESERDEYRRRAQLAELDRSGQIRGQLQNGKIRPATENALPAGHPQYGQPFPGGAKPKPKPTPPPTPKKGTEPARPAETNPDELAKKFTSSRVTGHPDPERRRGFFDSEKVDVSGDGQAIMKHDEDKGGCHPRVHSEAGAYGLAKAIGLDNIPITVVRHDKDRGRVSMQEFKANARTFSDRENRKINDPEDFGKMAMLDMIMANTDRHGGNALVTADGRLMGIDHGLAFDTEQRTASLNGFFMDAAGFYRAYYRNLYGADSKAPPQFRENVIKAQLPLNRKYKTNLEQALKDGSFKHWLKASELPADSIAMAEERAQRVLREWDKFFSNP